MASSLLHMNSWMAEPTRERLSKSKSYRITRYGVAALLITLSIVLLVAAWWLEYKDNSVAGGAGNLYTNATGTLFGELHRAPSSSLYQADLAMGILGLILGVAILGSRKQPFNLVLFTLGLIWIIIVAALVGLTFDTVVIVRVFVPATVTGV